MEWTDFDDLLDMMKDEPEVILTKEQEELLNEYEWQLDQFQDYEY